MKKKIIAVILICIMIFTLIYQNRVLGIVEIVEIEQLEDNQRLKFYYTASKEPVGSEDLKQVYVKVNVENLQVGMLSFRLGWDEEVVTPSIATGEGINRRSSNCIRMYNKK